MSSKVHELYDKLRTDFHASPNLERQVLQDLSRIIANAYTQSIGSDEGFCFKFNLPIMAVNKLITRLGLTPKDLLEAYKADWGSRAMTNNMHKDPYYQVLLLLMYYGIQERKDIIRDNALLILLLRIWNGRKSKFLKFCDKRIMKYVVSHMCNKRHLFARYDGPMSLLKDYYVPTLMKTYADQVKRDPKKLQRVLEQAWGRIHQQFVQQGRINIKTGKSEAQGGILRMYMKAKKEGLTISTPTISGMGDEGPSFGDYTTANNRDEIINSATDFITMNPKTTYPQKLISEVNRQTRISVKTIDAILKALHNHQYYDVIHDVLSIVLSRTNVLQKADICSPTFLGAVKKNVISSKNNADARKLQKLCNILLKEIFINTLSLPDAYDKFSITHQIQLRTVIVSGIVYNLRKIICK